jgi:hypothetical protein
MYNKTEKEIQRESEMKVYGFFRGIVKVAIWCCVGYVALHVLLFLFLYVGYWMVIWLS